MSRWPRCRGNSKGRWAVGVTRRGCQSAGSRPAATQPFPLSAPQPSVPTSSSLMALPALRSV